ncbi:MAG TPA: inactive serine/threonine-protein kinase VRK3, partial [Gemmatimonadales bacterium]|nr:inactive serine/threonine-protein kinase VRK3 [Gemmatimonadales bacterium]
MANASLSCSACHRDLSPDDQFCSRCGTPTPLNQDPEATLINPSGGDSPPSGGGPAVLDEAQAAAPLTGAAFKARLRQILGDEYELLSLIGQGGFARVYKARDRRLDRVVAIKVIRPDVMGTAAFVESFRNEGIALAKLRHPGIVPIYDIRQRAGLIYYIMPFVQG